MREQISIRCSGVAMSDNIGAWSGVGPSSSYTKVSSRSLCLIFCQERADCMTWSTDSSAINGWGPDLYDVKVASDLWKTSCSTSLVFYIIGRP